MTAPRDKLPIDPIPRKDVKLPPMLGQNGQRLYTYGELQAAIAAEMMGAWRDPSEYAAHVDSNADELVQVLCEVLSIDDEGWDHVSIGDHAVGDKFVSIGLRLLDEKDEFPWDVAGWDMQQDCFVGARGFRVLGWQPLARAALSTPICRRCEVPMVHGIATGQTYVGGLPDFEGDKHSSTFSVGGSGKVINVWKCPDCGSSISKGETK